MQLNELLRAIRPGNRFYTEKFAGLEPDSVALTDLPFTTKAELLADQLAHPPYGRMLTFPLNHYTRAHQTSGTTTGQPLRWLDTAESWAWMLGNWDIMFRWIGLRSDDRLFFPFSFGPFLGFWTAFEAAARSGYFLLPAGGLSSSARLRYLLDHSATVVFCTPTYAMHLAEVAAKEGIDLAGSAVRILVVAGEPGGNIPETRQRIETAWGARVFDHSGMTEIGPAAIECIDRPGGLQMVGSSYIEEVLPVEGHGPVTGAPGPGKDGEIGELVLTNLGRIGSPLIRYRTGDLVKAMPGPDGVWLEGGILGRVDDMLHVRGNNVYLGTIEALVRRFAEVVEFRIEIDRSESLANLRIEIECTPSADASQIVERLGRVMRDELLFRADILAVPPGSLPRFEMKAQRIRRK